jgi:hypothetical protein
MEEGERKVKIKESQRKVEGGKWKGCVIVV